MTESDPKQVMLTNFYLHPDDERVLYSLPAAVITKSRWAVSSAGRALAVDEFHGHLSGLVLAEAELGADGLILRHA